MGPAIKRPRGRPPAVLKTPVASVVQSLDRALTLIELVAQSDGIGLTTLSQRADMPPSTVHRLLMTLAAHGFVEMHEQDQRWSIGVEAFRAGMAFQRRNNAVTLGRPVMQELMELSGETANIGIFEGGEVVFVTQVESYDPIRAFFRAGERRSAHASGIGKAMLAHMPRETIERVIQQKGLPAFTENTITDPTSLFIDLENIQQRGYAIDNQERNLGMRCIAAAIFNEFGEAVAGVSVSGPASRLSDERIDVLGPQVRQGAAKITRLIGGLEKA
ncbi:HTH-type transcriptional regulator BhcR [Beijerinckia indica]|uniref:Transcriptional regulator, IclR family n=1 Tax=Beijerinckia indica subsp. indica (strain ATCC 9039 / DSM 1715 / NCIMB 8712) TaxID=395963 RepID=B2IEQ7_BEII9|nr:HTH-type transcriptional regulator BhcR [Beijerinckia indica]ACB96997.1 transcriptional regulator, IclR family [Beijerinckia indica subsp. indica ATCC 9039]